MKFLLATLLLLSSLSAFALPEDFYYDAPPYAAQEVEVVTVKVVELVDATSDNAHSVCQDLGYSKAASYSVSANSEAPQLQTVRCVR